jgi:hypothetical protein
VVRENGPFARRRDHLGRAQAGGSAADDQDFRIAHPLTFA